MNAKEIDMAYDVRLMKLINGEIIIGKYSEEDNEIKDVALLQTIPTEQGAQMMLLPFGYPFEQEISGAVSLDHVLYEYKSMPEELKNKYLEATTNLTLSTPGSLRNLNLGGGRGGKGPNIADLLKK
jgi:hypothetical protein